MAERTFTQLFDDLDQTEIAKGKGESVEFALRGTTYRIDLKRANVTKLEKALAPFVAAATPIKSPKKSGPRVTSLAGATRIARTSARTRIPPPQSVSGRQPTVTTSAHAVASRRRCKTPMNPRTSPASK